LYVSTGPFANFLLPRKIKYNITCWLRFNRYVVKKSLQNKISMLVVYFIFSDQSMEKSVRTHKEHQMASGHYNCKIYQPCPFVQGRRTNSGHCKPRRLQFSTNTRQTTRKNTMGTTSEPPDVTDHILFVFFTHCICYRKDNQFNYIIILRTYFDFASILLN